MKKKEKNIRFMGARKGTIYRLIMSARILRNTGHENIKRKILNAIYVNTEKNAQNIVRG